MERWSYKFLGKTLPCFVFFREKKTTERGGDVKCFWIKNSAVGYSPLVKKTTAKSGGIKNFRIKNLTVIYFSFFLCEYYAHGTF